MATPKQAAATRRATSPTRSRIVRTVSNPRDLSSCRAIVSLKEATIETGPNNNKNPNAVIEYPLKRTTNMFCESARIESKEQNRKTSLNSRLFYHLIASGASNFDSAVSLACWRRFANAKQLQKSARTCTSARLRNMLARGPFSTCCR